MITAVIIDDEKKSVSTLKKFLTDFCPEVNVLGIADSAKTGYKLITEAKPQLVFLDVEMPYGSGLELLESFNTIDFETIFITAFNHYALNAFRFAALDFLLKPVNITQLKEAVNRAIHRIAEKSSVKNYQLLLENLKEQDTGEQKIALTDSRGQHFIKLNDIIYCIADGSYTHIYLSDSKSFLSSRNLKEFEDMLPKSLFCRIHHGHIVNVTQVSKVIKGRGGSVVMRDGKELEIAVRRKDDFLKLIKK